MKQDTIITIIIFLIPLSLILLTPLSAHSANRHFAYAENIGWINLEPDNGSGITITESSLTGFAWGENIGWVNFSYVNRNTCMDVEYGVALDTNTSLFSGHAWGENIGWVNFSCQNNNTCNKVEYRVAFDTNTGLFSGNAWGENIGWISFPDNPYPAILLPINEGVNLFYASSVYKKPYMPPYNSNIHKLYYHDQNSIWVDSNCKYMKEDSLHALYTLSSGILYLDPKKTTHPILCFKGFLNAAFFPHQNYTPEQCVDPDIYDFMDNFDPNEPIMKLLETVSCLKMISGKNNKTGKREAAYRFFGKPAGKDVDLKSNIPFLNIIK